MLLATKNEPQSQSTIHLLSGMPRRNRRYYTVDKPEAEVAEPVRGFHDDSALNVVRFEVTAADY